MLSFEWSADGDKKRTVEHYIRNYYSFLKFSPVSGSDVYFV